MCGAESRVSVLEDERCIKKSRKFSLWMLHDIFEACPVTVTVRVWRFPFFPTIAKTVVNLLIPVIITLTFDQKKAIRNPTNNDWL